MAGGSGGVVRQVWRIDDFDGAVLCGTAFCDERGGADEALEVRVLFQDSGTCAEYLPEDMTVEFGGMGMDRLHELHA